jgi:hypothetical protein
VGFVTGYDPLYVFDAATRTWKRSYGNTPFVGASGNQVAPTNVIVQFVRYPDVSEGELLGQGDAWIFSDGFLVKGRWTKPDAATPTRFTDASGQVVALTPGRTWVELLPIGNAVDVVAAPGPPASPASVAPTTRAR